MAEDKFKLLMADIARAMKEMPPPTDPATTFLNNTLVPLFESFAELTHDAFVEHGNAIAGLIEEEGELVTEETARQISTLILVGAKISQILGSKLGADVSPPAMKIRALIENYAVMSKEVLDHVESITIPDEEENADGTPVDPAAPADPDSEDDEEDEDEDEDDDEDDDQEDA